VFELGQVIEPKQGNGSYGSGVGVGPGGHTIPKLTTSAGQPLASNTSIVIKSPCDNNILLVIPVGMLFTLPENVYGDTPPVGEIDKKAKPVCEYELLT
jgi:hypothetical protein